MQKGVTGILCLSTSDQLLQRLRLRSEADSLDVWLRVVMDDLPEKAAEALDLEGLSSDDLPGLNRLCQVIRPMKPTGREKLNAAVTMLETSGIVSLYRLAENLGHFTFVPGIHSPEEYGRYMIRQSGKFENARELESFFDYRRYGEQCVQEEGGQFNEYGYMACQGPLELEEWMRSDSEKFGPQMVGLSF